MIRKKPFANASAISSLRSGTHEFLSFNVVCVSLNVHVYVFNVYKTFSWSLGYLTYGGLRYHCYVIENSSAHCFNCLIICVYFVCALSSSLLHAVYTKAQHLLHILNSVLATILLAKGKVILQYYSLVFTTVLFSECGGGELEGEEVGPFPLFPIVMSFQPGLQCLK